jgi:hypothetical protein
MGQYYNPAILDKNRKTVKKWMYSHDYSNGLKLMEHSYLGNNFVGSFESLILNNPERVIWAGDYADNCSQRKTNVYNRCKDNLKVNPSTGIFTARYVINHSKKTFVDKNKVPKDKSNFNMKLHPLPLLTADGCGRGGGDFRGENPLIGTWARDIISVSSKKPFGFKELIFNVTEE